MFLYYYSIIQYTILKIGKFVGGSLKISEDVKLYKKFNNEKKQKKIEKIYC